MGSEIVFAEYDGKHFRLFVHELSTGRSVELTGGHEDDYAPVWSPDGTKIAWCRRPSKSRADAEPSEILYSNWPNFKAIQVTKSDRMKAYPVFTSDGQSIIFESGKMGQNFGLFRAFLNGTEKALLYEPERSGNGIPHVNGKEIVFEGTNPGSDGFLDVY